jgi:hypothetical protein
MNQAGGTTEPSSNSPEVPSLSIVTTSDFTFALSNLAAAPEGHDLLYSAQMESQIECTWDGSVYTYRVLEGEEEKPILNVSPEGQQIYCDYLRELDPSNDYSPLSQADGSFAITSSPKEEIPSTARAGDQSTTASFKSETSPTPSTTKEDLKTHSWWSSWGKTGSGWAMMGGGRLAPWEVEAAEVLEFAADGAAIATLLAVAPEVEAPVLAAQAARAARAAQVAEEGGVFSSMGRWLGRAASGVSRSLFGSGAEARAVGREAAQAGARAAQGVERASSLDVTRLSGELPIAQETDGAIESKVFEDDRAEVEAHLRSEERWEQIHAKNHAEVERRWASGEAQRKAEENGAKFKILPGTPEYEFTKRMGLDALLDD